MEVRSKPLNKTTKPETIRSTQTNTVNQFAIAEIILK